MASAILSIPTTVTTFSTTKRPLFFSRKSHNYTRFSPSPSPSQSYPFPPFSQSGLLLRRARTTKPFAYISGPVFTSESDPKVDGSDLRVSDVQPQKAVTWGLVWTLLMRHKLRLAFSVFTLVGCTTCTLSMPIISGQFFEVLIGARPGSLWKLLSKFGLLYSLEPILTVIFVINMTAIWEKVMATLRAQTFKRLLIQKVEFFDRYKVGEITGLLTSDLGSLKDAVSENVSRDRGFRALSEVTGTMCILFVLSPQLAPLLGVLMLTVSLLVGKHLSL